MDTYTIKYIRWGAAFKQSSSAESTISQINTINQVDDYDVNLLPKEVALKQYQKDKVYFFTFYRNDVPKGYADYNNGYFKIGFIDDLNREYLSYSFKRTSGGTLFLYKAQYWEYNGNTDEKSKTEIFVFNENGETRIKKADISTRKSVQLTSIEPVDVSRFYEEFPAFGEYDSLICKDRIDSLNLSGENIKEVT